METQASRHSSLTCRVAVFGVVLLLTATVGPALGTAAGLTKLSQTITFAPLPNRTIGSPNFLVSATASSGLSVYFTAAGVCTIIQPRTVHLTGVAGSCTITAHQYGNDRYYAAPNVARTFSVLKKAQTITFAALPNRIFGSPDFIVSATASSGLPVSFTAAGVCTVSGTTVHLISAGSCTITARQIGNAYYYAAPNVARAFSVLKTAQTITFAAPPAQTYGSPDFTVSATASSGLPVSLTAAGDCALSGTTVHLTGAGSCSITARQSGNAYYYAAPVVTRSFTVGKASQTITFASLDDKTFGDADLDVAAPVSSSGLPVSLAATGNCTLTDLTVHITGAGSCTVTASQAGDGNHNPAPDVVRTFTIHKADQSITFASLDDKTFGDANFTVSATSSSGLAVTFTRSGVHCTISGVTVHITGAGSCTITAHQGGNADYNAAPDVAQTFTIAKAAQVITFEPLADASLADGDFEVTATASSSLSVSFSASGDCELVTELDGDVAVHLLGVGTCTVTAHQVGSSNYLAAADVAHTFNITA